MIRIQRLALLAGTTALLATPALADDLREALVAAYNTNPTLQSARAQQRATDEGVPIARSAGLPNATSGATYSEILDKTANSPLLPNRNLSAGVDVGMPIYAGGGIKNSIRAAETRVEAGQADLRAVESDVFATVVASYMDVILAEAVVGFNRTNVQRLEVNLQATRDRFEIGDLTRTDVAQSESRLALARSSARSAEARLIAAREGYIQVVGKAPQDLQAPPKRLPSRSITTPTCWPPTSAPGPQGSTSRPPAPDGCRGFRSSPGQTIPTHWAASTCPAPARARPAPRPGCG
jgi:outer membrane protein